MERPREIHQVRGVLRRIDAGRQHHVVARVLAFEAEPRAREPDDGIEPVHGADDLADDLREPVAAADVRQLVPQDDAQPIVGPAARGDRQQDLRPRRAPRDNERGIAALEDCDRPIDADIARERARLVDDASALDPSGARGETFEPHETGDDERRADRGAADPEREDEGAKRRRAIAGLDRRPTNVRRRGGGVRILRHDRERCCRRERRRRQAAWRHRDAPGRDDEREQRHRRGTGERDDEQPVAQRRGGGSHQRDAGERRRDEERNSEAVLGDEDHRPPPFRAFETISAMRSSSDGERRPPSGPSSAVTTFSVDPSKKVSTRWRSADRRAARRGRAGV